MKRIAYVTDLHLAESFPASHQVDAAQNWKRIVADLKTEAISHLVVGGDLGEATSHGWFFRSLQGFSFDLTLGNHDNFHEIKKHVSPPSSDPDEWYYSREDEAFKYLFLDTSPDYLSMAQLRWLRLELETEKQVVLFLHHPLIEINTQVNTLYPLKNRQEVLSMVEDSQRQVTIFCGHYHLADEQWRGSIRQLVSPAVSFQMLRDAKEVVVDGSRFGYRLVTFNSDGTIETTVKSFANDHFLSAL